VEEGERRGWGETLGRGTNREEGIRVEGGKRKELKLGWRRQGKGQKRKVRGDRGEEGAKG
jgi:hypothetical protein